MDPTAAVAAAATNRLINVAHEELDARPKGLKIIAGDANADTLNLPFLITLIKKDGWTDIGAEAQI